jgi:hypothetical protein
MAKFRVTKLAHRMRSPFCFRVASRLPTGKEFASVNSGRTRGDGLRNKNLC